MNCPRCQKELPVNASACSACGFSFDDATQPFELPKTPQIKPGQKQVVEKVIDRCIQKDPSLRPSSALQVAAAVPRGDPLAAALPPRRTPPPETLAPPPPHRPLHPP